MKSFEIIAKKIQVILPIDWCKVVFYAEVTDDSYEMFYYVFMSDKDEPIQCYALPDLYEIEEDQIDGVFEDLYTPLLEEKMQLVNDGKEPWSSYTLVLSNNGVFKVDYDYTSFDEDKYEYLKEWKKKYLLVNGEN